MSFRLWLPTATTLLLSACGGNDDVAPTQAGKTKAAPRPTIISTTVTQTTTVEVIEHSVGALESLIRPEVSAEIEGRYIGGFVITGQRVKPGQLLAELDTEDYAIAARAADAEAAQLKALVRSQRRTVKRFAKLIDDKLISIDRYEEAQAQFDWHWRATARCNSSTVMPLTPSRKTWRPLMASARWSSMGVANAPSASISTSIAWLPLMSPLPRYLQRSGTNTL